MTRQVGKACLVAFDSRCISRSGSILSRLRLRGRMRFVEPKSMPLIGAAYFVSFVLTGTVIMLNLVIGVIINGIDEAQKELAGKKIPSLLTGPIESAIEQGSEDRRIKEAA